MNAADCLLVTSHTPTVIQEAMACHLPIVSVEVGDVRERLADVRWRAGLSRRDPRVLGEAVAAVLRQPLCSDGRKRAAELSVEAIAAPHRRRSNFYWQNSGTSRILSAATHDRVADDINPPRRLLTASGFVKALSFLRMDDKTQLVIWLRG